MKNKKIIIFVFIIMCLFSIASVSANDVNDTVNADPSDNVLCDVVTTDVGIAANHNESSVSQYSHDALVEWDDLDNDIQNLRSGDVYDIKHDYMKQCFCDRN